MPSSSGPAWTTARICRIIGLVQRGGFQEIVAIGSYADEGTGRAEVAFVVREDFQGMGVTSHMLPLLESIAKENGFHGFVATVLKENKSMMRVFKKRYPNAKVDMSGGLDNTIIMDFSPAHTPPSTAADNAKQ